MFIRYSRLTPGPHLHLSRPFGAMLFEILCPERIFKNVPISSLHLKFSVINLLVGNEYYFWQHSHIFIKCIFSKTLELQIKSIQFLERIAAQWGGSELCQPTCEESPSSPLTSCVALGYFTFPSLILKGQ